MESNYRHSQLREIKTEQVIEMDKITPSESEYRTYLRKSIKLNFQNSLSEDMARMLQHAY